MLSVRKQDPLFINFVPKTAEEAVDRFIRCKNRGLKAYLIPECLIACAQALDDIESEKFERWISTQKEIYQNMGNWFVQILTNAISKCLRRVRSA